MRRVHFASAMRTHPPFVVLVLMACLPLHAGSKSSPKLELKDLTGHAQKLSALRGDVVVLSFWATWCSPCLEELPRLSALQQDYAGKPVHFVAVSIDESKDRAKIQPFLQKHGVNLDVWVGGDTDTLARFGLGDIVPGTVVVDQQGEIIGRIMGEAKDQDVRSRVDWVLSGKQGAPLEPLVKRY